MKKFNITGVCVPDKHYMVNIDKKLEQIELLVESGEYFTINRPRQYGKTTTLMQMYNRLKDKYLVLKISFEGIGEKAFSSEDSFIDTFINLISRRLKQVNAEKSLIESWERNKDNLVKLEELSEKITKLTTESGKEIILIIDEIDKSTNNQLFLHFLGMLRNKYLDRAEGFDKTFKSVILAGVYDIKNLKLTLRKDEEKKLNSPWNIAADFDVDMSFSREEIDTMLIDYEKEWKIGINIDEVSEELFKFTRGYPFIVSKLCKLIDEKHSKNWGLKGLEDAVKMLLNEKNTLFDDLIKNLVNNKDLYSLIYDILIEGKSLTFNPHNPLIDIGIVLGILINDDGMVIVSNKVFEICIYNYMISKRSTKNGEIITYEYRSNFVNNDKLNMELVLNKFQEIMYEEYRDKDIKFIEREGRLLFLCFLKPIINGKGFYYVEAETRMDNRMDIIITYGTEQHIVELKIWHGDNYEQNALKQLAGYLDSKRESKGYLISYNFNKNKEYKKEWKMCSGKEIYSIVV